MIFYRYRKWYC